MISLSILGPSPDTCTPSLVQPYFMSSTALMFAHTATSTPLVYSRPETEFCFNYFPLARDDLTRTLTQVLSTHLCAPLSTTPKLPSTLKLIIIRICTQYPPRGRDNRDPMSKSHSLSTKLIIPRATTRKWLQLQNHGGYRAFNINPTGRYCRPISNLQPLDALYTPGPSSWARRTLGSSTDHLQQPACEHGSRV